MAVASQLNALTCMLPRSAEKESHRLMVQPSIKEFTVVNLIIVQTLPWRSICKAHAEILSQKYIWMNISRSVSLFQDEFQKNRKQFTYVQSEIQLPYSINKLQCNLWNMYFTLSYWIA